LIFIGQLESVFNSAGTITASTGVRFLLTKLESYPEYADD
jgi:hypothetical protein